MFIEYYAHSTSRVDQSDWERLDEHLKAVGAQAAKFAADFGAEDVARASGLLHDIGKYSERFQAYLRAEGPSVDHATLGAQEACKRFDEKLGRLLAYSLAGHHAGLANGRNGEKLSSLDERLAKVVEPIRGWECVSDLLRPPIMPSVQIDRATQGFQIAFFIRMVFSCLVDADFLETERFCSQTEGKTVRRGSWFGLTELRDRLNRHLAQVATDAPMTPVNRQRERILKSAREKAPLGPGLFSLTVPTGGGKTLSSLAFALDHALHHDRRRIIYVIPYTSVIEQTAAVFRRALGDDAVLEHHSAFDLDAVGHGEDSDEARDGSEKLRLAAENWDAPIVVTTAVQFFESLFAHKTSRCRKLHNIAQSVVILDEAQTLPTPLLRPCVAAIAELARNYGVSLVLCTATQPALLAPDFKDGLTNVREIAPLGLFAESAFRRVRIEHEAEPLDNSSLMERLRDEPQVLCIVNSRAHAQAIFQGLPSDGAFHLSTLMCAVHRRNVLATVRERLRTGAIVRLVSTSLIEAGVDISFPVVYRAETGLDSIAQAAGRCNREGRQADLGRVVVFRATEADAPRSMQRLVACARATLRRFPDPLSEAAILFFFQESYFSAGPEALDEKAILKKCEEGASAMQFPFETMANTFRMIDSIMVPVIIPYDEGARARICQLEWVDRPGRLARELQRYISQVPRKIRGELIAAGAVRLIQMDRFGDQFAVLENRSLYRPDVGLTWEDPTFMEATAQIV
ncbi:CRISPR-associated helicase Cas3' [Marinivivus vitaminiproducens]|uniref:CRISPR-associated helicase Cas3' n=1 Tax=Marinivivus vitaminiproducens TaxID=3035935 RepID=UPI0027A6E1BD|nr:CRISPR-associated helicase Cas3' [Geminicoccaceae bacterium SCSIO 64248]